MLKVFPKNHDVQGVHCRLTTL